MTSTHVELDNIGLVRQGYEAFAKADMARLSELFDAKAVWRGTPTGILKGDYDGRDAIFAMFGQLQQETGGTFRPTPITMAAAGDKVFVLSESTGERKGRKLTETEVLVFTLRDGRVREVTLYTKNHPAHEAFWA
jgi:uncharacterized protein